MVNHHDAVVLFEELQSAILHALHSASHLFTAIKQLKFQTALSISVKILSTSFPVSRYLQTVNLDFKTALEAANVQNNTQDIRKNCDVEFQQLFLSVITVCEKFDTTVNFPRQSKSDDPEYFLKYSYLL
ncbi:Hypothetical protein CINCED_3A023535 [Cinara cedri]|uniref:Uncharacterized protein n=1 Tax=Cinara cedri TaxID=506608 RepID=A0A5E4NQE9_9HEMI|nr:Hypothetical protein CINCED_3A023535 [Cinara cedri]